MIILGIDPGLNVTGFGLIEVTGTRVSYVASGCIRASGSELPQRLGIIFGGVRELIELHGPGEAAVENVFMHRNASSALKLGQARGAAISALVTSGIPVHEYTPAQIKQSMVGRGSAEKEQVRHMVCALLSLKTPPRLDASDALACALSHLHFSRTRVRVSRAMAAAGVPS
jgi:crossover junction endodeoxyribonuclease RuvC